MTFNYNIRELNQVNKNISTINNQAKSIDEYFTEEYDLKFNYQIKKELTKSNLTFNIQEQKFVFRQDNSLETYNSDKGISSNSSSLRFTPLDFFNLFYGSLSYINNYKSKPLNIVPYLNKIELGIKERLYFYHKLSDYLQEDQNDKSLIFICERIDEEFYKVWNSFFGGISTKEINLITEDEKKSIINKIERLSTIDKRLDFLIDVKHYLLEKELYSSADKIFLKSILLQIELNTEKKEKVYNNNINLHKPKENTKEITIEKIPIFKEDYIELIYKDLKPYFSPTQQFDLLNLLKEEKKLSTKLQFNSNGNKLAHAFKLLYERNIITSCTKRDLEKWISENFQYLGKDSFSNYKRKYLNEIISTNKITCKINILISL